MTHGACLVLGCGPCLFEDLERAPKCDDVMVVNRAGLLYLEPIRQWSSAHGKDLVGWVEERRRLSGDMNFRAFGNFTRNQESGIVERRNKADHGGSSAMYATLLAIEHGWQKIILCGVPLDGNDSLTRDGVKHYESGYWVYRRPWEDHFDEIKDNVRSMSGWTRELLGEPTAEWLNS